MFEDDGPIADSTKNTSPGKEDRFREVRRVHVSQSHPAKMPELDVLDEVEECPLMSGSIRKALIKASLAMSNRLWTRWLMVVLLTGSRRCQVILLPFNVTTSSRSNRCYHRPGPDLRARSSSPGLL